MLLTHLDPLSADLAEHERAEMELREREEQYRSIFESTSDALLIFDFDGTIVEANPAACRMYGYSYEELIGLSGKDIVHPDYHRLFEDFRRQVRASGRFHTQSVDLRKDGSLINVEVHGVSFSYQGKPHLLAVVRDITERVRARQILEQRVEERTRQLSTLLEVSRSLASTLKLEPLLGLILDQLKAVVDYDGAAVMTLEGEDLVPLAYRGPIPQEKALQMRFPLERASVNREVIRRRQPVIIPDVRGDAPLARAFQQTAGEELETTFGYIRSWLGVPLMVKDRVIGMITLDRREPWAFGEEDVQLALAFANQAALAIENARLFAQAEQRMRELEALYQAEEKLNRAEEELYRRLRLDLVLQTLVDVAVELLQADKSSLMVWDAQQEKLVVRAAHGFSPETMARMSFALGEGIVGRVAASGEPMVVEDTRADPCVARRITEPEGIRSFMHVPIKIGEQVFGVFNVSYTRPRAFNADDRRLFLALAQRAALAIENARLYEQAQQAATLEERQRVARELHDSVAQAIYGITLYAEAATRLLAAGKVAKAAEHLRELRDTAQEALRDMRLLLFELRPPELEQVGLAAALQARLEAVEGRAGLETELRVEGEGRLPFEIEEGLYRIAQEALNNALKHAQARKVTVYLRQDERGVTLEVADDGIGFDPKAVEGKGMGLRSIAERVRLMGGRLEIQSGPGKGTRVRVNIGTRGSS